VFWDSSALVSSVVAEPSSPIVVPLLRSDPVPVLWWASPVECHSALYRQHREGSLPAAMLHRVMEALRIVLDDADLVVPTTAVRERASHLLATYPLRASDALQLAAAFVWCGGLPRQQGFVCLDRRLRDAARGAGFQVLPA
jgi:predicted nucleic acid-binding protein